MQTLLNVLLDYDRGQLHIIAELCGFPPDELSEANLAQELAARMLEKTFIQELLEGLDSEARSALLELQSAGGRLSTTEMEHRFGPLRRMGAGRRDQEKPWRDPASTHEYLWYAGLIAHAFADSPQGPREYTYIPTDLLQLLPQPAPQIQAAPGTPAPTPDVFRSAGAYILDDAATILAALRRRPERHFPFPVSRQDSLARFLIQPASLPLLTTLLIELDVLDDAPYAPDPDRTRAFLETDPGSALSQLNHAWQESQLWNDLASTPGIAITGKQWPNDPVVGRKAVCGFLAEIPIGSWWSLDRFREAIFLRQPDFQRPAGDFDSWYLQHSESGVTLRGIEDWDQVDGALVNYIITGPLHWLGVTDLGFHSLEQRCLSFRLTPWAATRMGSETPLQLPTWDASCQVKPDGMIRVPRKCSHGTRYQISRFAAWRAYGDEVYSFQLTPRSLEDALNSGLQVHHILKILEQAGEGPLPESIRQALENWNQHRCSGQIQRRLILSVSDPDALKALREHRSTARYLGENLGPDSIEVVEKGWRALYENALKLGIWLSPPEEAGEESP